MNGFLLFLMHSLLFEGLRCLDPCYRHFNRDINLDNRICAVDNRVLFKENVRSPINCFTECTKLFGYCQSVFYKNSAEGAVCHGCRRNYTSTEGLLDYPGSIYFNGCMYIFTFYSSLYLCLCPLCHSFLALLFIYSLI